MFGMLGFDISRILLSVCLIACYLLLSIVRYFLAYLWWCRNKSYILCSHILFYSGVTMSETKDKDDAYGWSKRAQRIREKPKFLPKNIQVSIFVKETGVPQEDEIEGKYGKQTVQLFKGKTSKGILCTWAVPDTQFMEMHKQWEEQGRPDILMFTLRR